MLFEPPLNMNPSGTTYVAARLRRPEDDDTDQNLQKLLTAKSGFCDHVGRICKDCAYRWNWDYVLLLERTAGGRSLKALLPEGWENGPGTRAG